MPLINFSGLASGIDSEALISATSEATRTQRVTPLENQISQITEEGDALSELKGLFSEIKDLGEEFMTINGGVISKSATSSDETVLTAVASTTAQLGSYDIDVNQLAKNALFSFSERTSDPDADIGPIGAGTYELSIDIGTAPDETILIQDVNTKSWAEVATEINEFSEKVTANLVNVGTSGSPSYALVISTTSIGEDSGSITVTSTPDLLPNLDSTVPPATLDQATNAELTISGITGTIERSSNTISDLIPGVTFNLGDVSTSSVNITVANDTAATQSKIEAFIEKYNEMVRYIAENNTITRQENGDQADNIFAALASTRLDDGALSSLRSVLSSTNYEDGTSYRILSELGITTDRDGTLLFDSQAFQTAMSEDPNAVKQIMIAVGDTISNTGGTIDQYIQFNGLFDTSINSGKERVTDLNKRIGVIEASIAKNEETLRARFARLESTISKLQGQQSALTSALAGLGNNG